MDMSKELGICVANLTEIIIQKSYGVDVRDVEAGALMLALAAVKFSDTSLDDVEALDLLRGLVASKLKDYACDCVQCDHDTYLIVAGSRLVKPVCDRLVEPGTPTLGGKLLCGSCHIAYWKGLSPEKQAEITEAKSN